MSHRPLGARAFPKRDRSAGTLEAAHNVHSRYSLLYLIYIALEHRPQPVVPTSLVPPEVVVQPSLFLRRVAVVQVDVVVVVAMAVVVAVVAEDRVVEAARRQQCQPREAHGQR